MKIILLISILASMLILTSCDPDDDNPSGEKSQQFLTLHLNQSNKLGKGAYLSILEVKGKQTSYRKLNETYPANELRTNVEISNNRVVIGLHTDFNVAGTTRQTNGAWFDVADGVHTLLPVLPAGKGRYSYLSVSTVKVSSSGHCFYLSATNDASYHDQYETSLVRYNPKTGVLDEALDPASFAVNQPEKGWDTETGQYKSAFYPSSDGRYVYGTIETFGVDGGALHWDYSILFKYDFERKEYTRLGDASDKSVFVYGITSDSREILYQGSTGRKRINVNTNVVAKITIAGGQGYTNTSRWNSAGYCSGETSNTIWIYNLLSDETYSIKTAGDPYYAQFSADGTQLYFMLKSSAGKFLCRTSDLTKEAVIDTLCTLSADVTEFMVVK